MPGESRPPVALIAGPTASGKSALAVRLAQIADGVVINADASQVYADLAILSARPSQEEMGGVPHRLFGHIDGAEACSAARWAAEARAEIDAAHEAGKLPVLVGGTGLYIRTLLDGIAPVPEIDADIRAAVRATKYGSSFQTDEAFDLHISYFATGKGIRLERDRLSESPTTQVISVYVLRVQSHASPQAKRHASTL